VKVPLTAPPDMIRSTATVPLYSPEKAKVPV